MPARYRVFISSTMRDLEDERTRLASMMHSLEIFEPVRAETLPACEDPSRIVCIEHVRTADVIVLVVGKSYGFIPDKDNPENLSVTHLEYREAKRLKKPILAFLLDCEEREGAAESFITEIEDFDAGVFRRKWRDSDGLQKCVQSSLLWWIARLSRAGVASATTVEAIRGKLQIAGLESLNFFVGFGQSGTDLEVIREAVAKANFFAARNCLPVLQEAITASSAQIAIYASSDDNSLSIQSNIGDTESCLRLDVRLHPIGVNLVQSALLSLCYMAAQDLEGCASVLLEAAKSPAIDTTNKSEFLLQLVRLSMQHDLERALEAAEEVLSIEHPNEKLLEAVCLSMFATIIRFERKRAQLAATRARAVYIALLEKVLLDGKPDPEVVYSIARPLLLEFRITDAVRLYFALANLYPYYEERWYWHRDLGLHFYSVGDLSAAALYYDKACALKPELAELFRYAGDTYYYRGCWPEALQRYEKAIELEFTEAYRLDVKRDYARGKLITSVSVSKAYVWRRKVSARLSAVGELLARQGFRRVSMLWFRAALKVHELDYEAARWIALAANRRGDYQTASKMLLKCLANRPEDVSCRLNLVANLLFLNCGKLDPSSKDHLKAAIFNGGPKTRERFAISLINTDGASSIMVEFDALLMEVRTEYDAAAARRAEKLKPEKFGRAYHIEA